MSRRHIVPLFILLLAIGLVAFYFKRYRVPPAIDLPAISLTDMSGKQVALKSLGGHPLLISFFATWCGPCIHELPALASLHKEVADQNLQVICISDESPAKLQNLSVRFEGQILFLHSETPMKDIGIYTFPTNYIFNARGRKVYNKTGPDEWADPVVIARIRASIAH